MGSITKNNLVDKPKRQYSVSEQPAVNAIISERIDVLVGLLAKSIETEVAKAVANVAESIEDTRAGGNNPMDSEIQKLREEIHAIKNVQRQKMCELQMEIETLRDENQHLIADVKLLKTSGDKQNGFWKESMTNMQADLAILCQQIENLKAEKSKAPTVEKNKPLPQQKKLRKIDQEQEMTGARNTLPSTRESKNQSSKNDRSNALKSQYPTNKEQEMSAVQDCPSGQFCCEATFSYTVENINQLKSQQLSPPIYLRKLPWKILVKPNYCALGVFLQCNGEDKSPNWSCKAIAELRLKSHNPDAKPRISPQIKHTFHAEENDFGYPNFVRWQELVNPDKGYVLNNSITLEVYLIV